MKNITRLARLMIGGARFLPRTPLPKAPESVKFTVK